MHENNAYCFLHKMANLLTFIFMMVEFEKLPYRPDLKMVPICLVKIYESLQKATMFK